MLPSCRSRPSVRAWATAWVRLGGAERAQNVADVFCDRLQRRQRLAGDLLVRPAASNASTYSFRPAGGSAAAWDDPDVLKRAAEPGPSRCAARRSLWRAPRPPGRAVTLPGGAGTGAGGVE